MQRTYTIKEFEKVTGVSAHTLRYFDRVGLLSPARLDNGYRTYSLKQVSIAEFITLLQQAMFSNAEIKEILSNYNSQQTIESLKVNQKKLRDEIINLRRAHGFISEHIAYLEQLTSVRDKLNIPFIEQTKSRTVGLVQPDLVRDIVDFFDTVDEIILEPTWPHFFTHGMLVDTRKVTEAGYPLETMYVENSKVAKVHSHTIPAGRYLCMYCDQSMEDNPHAIELIRHAQQTGFHYEPFLYIEKVSGPVIEKRKQDFLVKLMLKEK
ncbi:MerR family transcriptional regulator [Vibrio fluvialis]|nr:MerR family transcriptional regulator [Vibrio fluvialis]